MISMLALGGAAYSQAWTWDSVAMGPGYANDIYYSMNNNQIKSEDNKNWHLAFSLSIGDSAAVWANHNGGNNYVKVYNVHKDKSQWASVALGDTAAANLCFNHDMAWFEGAFNDIPSADPFNYGWGTYDAVSHNIVGDSVFIVKANNVFYKVIIDSLNSMAMNWHFRVNDFNGADSVYMVSKQPNFTNRLFAYFNLGTGTDTNREPDIATWDLLFTRYNSLVSLGGPPQPYSVVGALGNKGIKFAQALQVHVDTAYNHYADYAVPDWSRVISSVGYGWKTFDQPNNVWIVPDSISYFVLDKANDVWQLQFTAFGGGADGKIVFRKRKIANLTSVNDVTNEINGYSIYPVPAQQQLNVLLDSKVGAEAVITLNDIQGRVLMNRNLKLNTGLNAIQLNTGHLPSGNYILNVNGQQIRLQEKVSILR